MSVLLSSQCRVDTCREQGKDGEIALGNKICWPFRGPTGLNHKFLGKLIYTCFFTKAQNTHLVLTFSSLSLSDASLWIFPSFPLDPFLLSSAHTCTPYLVWSFHFFSITGCLSLLISVIHPASIHIPAYSSPAILFMSPYLKFWCLIEKCGSLTDVRWLKCCDTVIAEDSKSCQLKTNY